MCIAKSKGLKIYSADLRRSFLVAPNYDFYPFWIIIMKKKKKEHNTNAGISEDFLSEK